VDLLEHEVTILAALDGVGGQIAFADRARGGRAAGVRDLDGLTAHLGNVALLEKHEAPGDGQQRRHVGRHEIFIDAESDDDGTSGPGEHHTVRIAFGYNRESIGSLELGDGLAHGRVQVGGTGQVMMYAVRDHFGIGFRIEAIAQVDEPVAQRLMILDDPVMDDGDAVAGHVRMRVSRCRHAVGGPSGMGDSHMAVDGVSGERGLERVHFAHRAHSSQSSPGRQHRKSGGVVAAVFETAQALHQDGDSIALRDHTDYSAHVELLPRGPSKGCLVCPSEAANPASCAGAPAAGLQPHIGLIGDVHFRHLYIDQGTQS